MSPQKLLQPHKPHGCPTLVPRGFWSGWPTLVPRGFHGTGWVFAHALLILSALAFLAGCTVHEGRNASGEKKVDITTPFGNLNVNTDVDVKDTGLPVYPGAQRVPGMENNRDAANVNISVAGVGLKVVAIKYRSDDPPDKVLAFYRPKMKDFGGKFLECRQEGFVSYSQGDDSKELTCDHHGSQNGTNTELKAGTPDRQHIVAVKPVGSGSEFALVYVMKRGKEGM